MIPAPGVASGAHSLQRRLLLGILLPVLVLIVLNTVSLYRQALRAADTAYDRTLLASAKSLGESLEITGTGAAARVQATVPYSALEAFEADSRSRMYYKVSGFQGEWVSGFDDLPAWRGTLPAKGIYAALVDFYNDRYRDRDVRVAVLLQPVASGVQLCQYHCPVAHVAAEFPELCEAETRAFSQMLDSHVQRLATIAHGDGVCTTHVPRPVVRPTVPTEEGKVLR